MRSCYLIVLSGTASIPRDPLPAQAGSQQQSRQSVRESSPHNRIPMPSQTETARPVATALRGQPLPRTLLRPFKRAVQAALAQFGYQIRRIPKLFAEGADYDRASELPPGAVEELRPDNPKLLDLERRYRSYDSPVCRHTLWSPALRSRVDELRYFRGDTAYVWAYRAIGDSERRFYIYGDYVQSVDHRGLMGGRLTEDGAFGCFTYRFEKLPLLSRDLLDSVNELYFLDRTCDVLTRKGLRVLDIGAGYGRMAHRLLAANEDVERYWCIDAIPRSTFLCDYHLRYRGLAGAPDSRAVVVPLDQMETAITPGSIDLAVNIHSFSEMCYEAIEGWIQWLVRLKVPRLFIIPNQPELLSTEADDGKTHRDFGDILERAGYRRIAHEPTLRDGDVRQLVGVNDFFWLFERS